MNAPSRAHPNPPEATVPLFRRLRHLLHSLTRTGAVLLIVGSAALISAGAVTYDVQKGRAEQQLSDQPVLVGTGSEPRVRVVDLQSAGNASRAALIVAGADLRGLPTTGPTGYADVTPGETFRARVGIYRELLHWDFALLAGCGLGLAGLSLAGAAAYRSRSALLLMRCGAAAAVGAAAFDAVGNVLVLQGLDRLPAEGDLFWSFAQAAGLVKWTLLVVAVSTAVAALWSCVPRLLRRPPAVLEEGSIVAPYPVVDADTGEYGPQPVRAGSARPPHAHWWGASQVPKGREPAWFGIAVSGGGVRSATVTLGALQRLQHRGLLQRARYLVSVSGGGYTASAYQLALHGRVEHPRGAAGPDDVFAPGTPEEDHLRRHGQYLADGPAQWAIALLTVLRNAAVSLGLIWAAVVALGALARALVTRYSAVSLTGLTPSWLQPKAPGPQPEAPPVPGIPIELYLTPLAILGAGVAAYLVILGVFVLSDGTQSRALDVARMVFVGSALVAVLALLVGPGIPLMAWAAVTLTYVPHLSGTAAGIGGGLATLLTGYLGVVVAILGKATSRISKAADSGRSLWKRASGKDTATVTVPGGLTAALVTWAAVAVLVFAAFEAFGLTVAMFRLAWHGRLIALFAVVALASVALDETWLSLHRFYRRRLASAFSVRREALPEGPSVARSYDYSGGPTPLSDWGAPVAGFPQLIMAAAAHVGGQSRTPPGRRTVSYTFSHDWVGGPQLGWVGTRALEKHVEGTHLARDLTVQSAAAVSGAAFASAMGRHATPYQTLMTLSNARLGTWLPNVAALHEADAAARRGDPAAWQWPTRPQIRRMPYFVKELLGIHSVHDPLVLVTDGGHYENLGLVELLRHRVRNALVIDASGDTPPLATTLAEAITLAKEELGIEITFDDDAPTELIPGTGTKLSEDASVAALNARLSRSLCVTGTIHYPAPGQARPDEPFGTGRLVVVKTGLTATMPYPVLSYAVGHPTFPRDTTTDQWFDVEQFDAYQAVGSYLGDLAVDALTHPQKKEQPGRTQQAPVDLVLVGLSGL